METSMKRIFLILVMGWLFNCSTTEKRDLTSVNDYEICEEENAKDCKFQFENY